LWGSKGKRLPLLPLRVPYRDRHVNDQVCCGVQMLKQKKKRSSHSIRSPPARQGRFPNRSSRTILLLPVIRERDFGVENSQSWYGHVYYDGTPDRSLWPSFLDLGGFCAQERSSRSATQSLSKLHSVLYKVATSYATT